MDDDEATEFWLELLRLCRERSEIQSLKRQFAAASPEPTSLNAGVTNAVFIDGAGRTREINIPDFRPEYRFPVPRRFAVTFDDEPPRYERPPVARFRLSSVQGGSRGLQIHQHRVGTDGRGTDDTAEHGSFAHKSAHAIGAANGRK